jgi:histidyl-tRNA synthetase
MSNSRLSKLPYKGTSDSYPEDMIARNFIFDTWSRVAKRFGYEEYDTPLIEDANLYRVKSGEELANTQLYSFTDKGGREISLRPEMTPSLARIVAKRKNELTMPIRWFNVGKYYRYEKPQRGRSREFIQLNIDILGVSTIEAELEIIQYVMEVMKEFKAPKETFELKINSRYLLDYLFENILELDNVMKSKVSKAIDNYLKLKENDFQDYLAEIGLKDNQIKKLLDFLTWSLEDLEEIKESSKGAKELIELFSKCNSLNIENVKFCPYIVRGLEYYTGIVIEMFDIGSKDNPRALFGGGRYDDLLSIFGEEEIPAFGLGWGDITTYNYLLTYNLIPEIKTNTEVFVTLMDKSLFDETSKLATYLRSKSINTQMQLTESKLQKQLRCASRKGIPWVVIVGEDEIKNKTVILKDMTKNKQYNLKMEEIPNKIL